MADTTDLDKRRRDLHALSAGLIIFSIAGGHLSNATALYFGAITVDRPATLLWSAWLLWAYFLWRFWQEAKPVWKTFQNELYEELEKSKIYLKFCLKQYEWIESEYAPETLQNRQDIAQIRIALSDFKANEVIYRIKRGNWGKSLDRKNGRLWKHGEGGRGIPFPQSIVDAVDEAVPWDESGRSIALHRAAVSAMVRRDAFANRLLPIIFAFVTLLVAAVSSLFSH